MSNKSKTNIFILLSFIVDISIGLASLFLIRAIAVNTCENEYSHVIRNDDNI